MQEHLGRPLLPEGSLHHRDGGEQNNAIENLKLWSSNHSYGQRVEDLVAHAHKVLEQ